MRLSEEVQELARGLSEALEPVENYPRELQPFMTFFLQERYMIESKGKTESFRFQSYQHMLLEQGVLRQAPFFVPDDDVFVRAEKQNCYLNSYNAICELPDYTYVEGLAQTNLLLVQHAWLEDPDGNIVDPTWAMLRDEPFMVTPTYYGIRFDTDFVLERANETGWCSIFARDWEQRPDYPSLRHGFKLNEQGRAYAYDREDAER
jgi:hypothetical protein